MKQKLINLFKFSAYLEFPDKEIPALNECPPGPHFKHRRFFLWSKRDGWKWGNLKRKAVNYLSLDEHNKNLVGMVSQVWSLYADTAVCCFWNGTSVIIDLDAYYELRKPRKEVVDYIHRVGSDPYPVYSEPAVNESMAKIK